MKELKAISGNEIREDIDYNTRGVDPENKEWRNYGKELCNTLYYRKYEADKVIADLEESHKKEVKELLCLIRDKDKNFYRAFDSEEKELRHNKFKRCLAMARIAQDDWHLHNSFYAMGHQEFEKRKCEFYEKWRQRWLKIAEQFKDKEAK